MPITPIFSDRAGDPRRVSAVRIPLPPTGPNGGCQYDSGRAVAQVWYPDGTIRSYCADHDEPQWPLPAERPFWWHGDWPYGPPPSYAARLRAWLRAFPVSAPQLPRSQRPSPPSEQS